MKTALSLPVVAIGAFLGVSAWAAIPDSDDHKTHHAQASAPAVRLKPQATGPSTATMDRMTQMEGQMKIMGGMQGGGVTPGNANERQMMMEKRMDMMQTMMDRVSPPMVK